MLVSRYNHDCSDSDSFIPAFSSSFPHHDVHSLRHETENVLQHMSLLAAMVGCSRRISGVVDRRILSACLPKSLPGASNKQQDNRFTPHPGVHTPKNNCQLQQEEKEEKEKEEEREREKKKKAEEKKRRRRTRTRIGKREGEQGSKGSKEEMGKANCIKSNTICLPHTVYMYICKHKYAYGHEVASGSENGKRK